MLLTARIPCSIAFAAVSNRPPPRWSAATTWKPIGVRLALNSSSTDPPAALKMLTRSEQPRASMASHGELGEVGAGAEVKGRDHHATAPCICRSRSWDPRLALSWAVSMFCRASPPFTL